MVSATENIFSEQAFFLRTQNDYFSEAIHTFLGKKRHASFFKQTSVFDILTEISALGPERK